MMSPEQVGERYLSVHHRMRRAVDEGMIDCGLTLARTKVLTQLKRRGPSRQSVLAVDFGFAPHTITDIVDALERDGLVTRQPDPTDRRAKLVALTGQGEVALSTASATREQLMKHVFGALDAADRVTMMRLLDVLDSAIAELIACPAPAEPAAAEPAAAEPAAAEPAAAEPAAREPVSSP
jgi:DNA-binding MarR family transcriptional regulator